MEKVPFHSLSRLSCFPRSSQIISNTSWCISVEFKVAQDILMADHHNFLSLFGVKRARVSGCNSFCCSADGYLCYVCRVTKFLPSFCRKPSLIRHMQEVLHTKF